jgi:MFS family permease
MFVAIMLPYVCYAFCWNTENFLRPFMADSLQLSKEQVAAFYTLQALGALVGAIVLSQLADRFSRRTTYALLTVGFGLAALGTHWVNSYAAALIQRFVMGFFLGGVFGCAVSLYVGLFSPTVRGLLAGLVQLVYNGGDALLSWFGRLYAADHWQQVMTMGGSAAVLAGIVAWFLIPTEQMVAPWGGQQVRTRMSSGPPVVELFVAGRWRLTMRLALLCGLNFFAFQAFNGWITTYLHESNGYSADTIGRVLTALHVGSMIGAIGWGLVADRFGRRTNALGFVGCALLIVVYLQVPPSPTSYAIVGFFYGACMVTTGIWGPYFAELYPEHLRATAASIFNWGRVVSLFGALLAGNIAEHYGLTTIMYIGGLVFALAAVLWWSLPETLSESHVVTSAREAR